MIYAFGLILHDLLSAGIGAATAESKLTDVRASRRRPRRLTDRSRDPRSRQPDHQPVCRARPGARYQTTAELAEEIARLDDSGKRLPIVRRLTWRIGAAALSVFVVLLALTWWLARGPAPAVQRPPMSVLVADFQNKTEIRCSTARSSRRSRLESRRRRSSRRIHGRSAASRTEGPRGCDPDEATARLVALAEEIKLCWQARLSRAARPTRSP